MKTNRRMSLVDECHWLILYLKECARSLLPGYFACIACLLLSVLFDCLFAQETRSSSLGLQDTHKEILILDVGQIWMVSHMARSRNLYSFLFQISFLDYMAYLPLFLSIHQNICDNALDMSRNKYQRKDTTWPRVTLETIWRAEWRSARIES